MQVNVSHLGCAAMVAMFLCACDKNHQSQTPQIPVIKKKKADYVVAIQAAYPPFSSRDEKGNSVGFDVDILQAIAKQQNFTLKFVPHTEGMNGLLDKLERGDADLISGIRFSAERMAKYDFSEPYFEDKWGALTHQNVRSFAQLKNQMVAVQENSQAATQLEHIALTKQVLPVESVYLGARALHKGNATAVYDVQIVLQNYVSHSPDWHWLEDKHAGRVAFGIVMKKGSTELKTKLDSGLQAIKADGTYDKIVAKWQPQNPTPNQSASQP